MDDSKKPKKINIDLEDLLDVELDSEPIDKLVVNVEDMPLRSKDDAFYNRQPELTYKQRRPPIRRRSKGLKLALIPLGLIILLASFFLLNNLFFGSEPEFIALENPSFRPTDPATIITDPQTGAEMVAGEIVIIAREGSSVDDINRIAALIGGKVIGSMADLNIYQIEISGIDAQSIDWAINQIEQEPAIEVVKPNYVPDLLNNAQKEPKDPQWTEWTENKRWGQEYINLPEAWDITTGSSKVKIGIIEMGFDIDHYELQHMQIISGNPKYDFIKKSENHGNMVAGIIGARANNSKGIAGVLWEADYYGFIIHSEMDLINAIREASKRGISIVNISLMFGGWENEGKNEFDQKIFDQLNAQFIWLVSNFPDIIFVQAAGNNPKVGVDQMPLASLAVEFDNVITVGSIKKGGYAVEEHSSGKDVSIAAPGHEIRSTKSRDLGARLLPGLLNKTYKTDSGTSYATPFVTGVAGLILSVAPDLSPGEVKRIIMETKKPHVFDGSQFPLGTGVVDAYAAVLEAKALSAEDEDIAIPPDEESEDTLPLPQPVEPVRQPPEHLSTQVISAGDDFSLALNSDGTVWAWGRNGSGQLGDGTTESKHNPVKVSGLTNVVAISAGYDHALALKSDGTVWAWGRNRQGQVGDNCSDPYCLKPVQVAGLNKVVAISAGASHSLALAFDGTVWAWGVNTNWGYRNIESLIHSTPVQVEDLNDVVSISAGTDHSLALKSDGTVWRLNRLGIDVYSLNFYTDISAGSDYAIALDSDSKVWGWGTSRKAPFDFTKPGIVKESEVYRDVGMDHTLEISAGYSHALTLKIDGTVWACGSNASGQLGEGTSNEIRSPVQVSSLKNVVAISAGGFHSLALKSDGTVWAWGSNRYGQVGVDGIKNSFTPVQVKINLGAQ